MNKHYYNDGNFVQKLFALSKENPKLILKNPVKAGAGIATIIKTTPFKKPMKITAFSAKLQSRGLEIKP